MTTALDFAFPPRCIGCGCVGSLFCPDCQAEIPVPPPLDAADGPLAARRATAEFTGAIQQCIHALKYAGRRIYADPLSQRLASELARTTWQPTLVAATPLYPARLQERGYNQAALLAARLAPQIRLPFSPDVIRRIRDTRSQVGLSARDRQANVSGAFWAVPELAAGQRIVLIDDVYTTGATLRACASALLEAGAACVWGLTVASARYRDSALPLN